MIVSILITSIVLLFGIIAISIFGAYLILFIWQNFRQTLGWFAFNVGYAILVLICNIVGTIATFSFKHNSRIEYYNFKEVELHWHFLVKDVNALHQLFEQPTASDLFTVKLESYEGFLEMIEGKYQQIATTQTKKFADYLADNFGKDYKILYQFMRMHFDYESEELDSPFESVKLPNKLWEDGKGDCEDFGLFISGVLSNWGITHELSISVFDNKAHFFAMTTGGTIIDPCCHKFNKRINGKMPLWETGVIILADSGSDVSDVIS